MAHHPSISAASLNSLREVVRPVLDRVPGLRFVLLFGSGARGEDGPDSDLDLAFEADDDAQIDRLALMAELGRALGRDVDLVDLRHDPGYPLRQAILKDSWTLYQRVPESVAQWRSAAIEINESFRPAYERMRNSELQRLAEEARE